MSTLIRNGLVLLVDGAGWKTEKKDIRIDGNRIVRVGEDLPAEGCTVIDATDRLVIPGLINAHTHAYMTMHRNYADDLAFFDWLNKVQQVEDGMTEEDIYWATLLAIIEMIRSGTTCFVDMTIKSAKEKTGPLSAAAGAVAHSGFRAVISRGLAGVSDSEESLMKFGQAVREMEMFKDESRLQFIHGPHAPYSCMADYLQKLTQSCKDRGIGQTIHLSESQAEMDGVAKEHGTTPIQYVDSQGVFDVPCIVAHAVFATEEDIRIMAEKHVSVAINPKSNMKLGNGFAPAKAFLDAGINVKGANRQAQCIGAADVLKMATLNGAKAIGREGELGEIREGALADLVLLRLNEPQFIPANNLVSGLVYSAKGSEVDTVLVDGRVLLEDGKLTTIDENRVYGEIRKITARLGMAG